MLIISQPAHCYCYCWNHLGHWSIHVIGVCLPCALTMLCGNISVLYMNVNPVFHARKSILDLTIIFSWKSNFGNACYSFFPLVTPIDWYIYQGIGKGNFSISLVEACSVITCLYFGGVVLKDSSQMKPNPGWTPKAHGPNHLEHPDVCGSPIYGPYLNKFRNLHLKKEFKLLNEVNIWR